MQELVAGVEKIRFDLEADVEQQRGAEPLPFPGMDKLGAAVCEFFHRGLCTKGARCPFRHVGGDRTVVCKHWLRGLCKKGDGCEFLHEYDVTKMPECYFYSKLGQCSNKDCPFLHIDATTSTVGCPWYDRGFCRHGPLCKYKHTRRVLCANYLVGFCPEGPKCKFMQYGAGCPRGLVQLDPAAGEENGCKDVPPMEPPLPVTSATQHPPAQLWDTKSCPLGPQSLLERGTCFKCRQKGHRATECGRTQLEILLGE
ncbi:putative cleavage and polyadenylation specificity factor subunit 4-like protein [Nyctibius grandis]|uniref:putative cleavage and polyadenylation specificity factor subunit 4-like protein n=1 Tax=Nyctibius grandis TaxID=48427 RepID=UPI0035BBD31C